MTDPTPYERGSDPLGRDTPLSYETTLPVLGIATRYRTNAPTILEVAEEAFGAWRVLDDHPDLLGARSAAVTLLVHEGDEGPDPHAPVRYRSLDGRRILLATPGSQAVAEPLRGDALGWVTPALAADRDHFRYNVLEALTFAVLSQMDRVPLHAAGLARDGAVLLLVGPSGVGKSTLTYAAAREGVHVLAEDIVHVQRSPGLRVWGRATRIHLLGAARSHFPELGRLEPTLLANGKEKIVLDLEGLGALAPLPVARRVGVCVLVRDPATREPSAERLSPDRVLAALDIGHEPGFDTFGDELGQIGAGLAREGGWRLALGPDPSAAVPLLEEMLERLG